MEIPRGCADDPRLIGRTGACRPAQHSSSSNCLKRLWLRLGELCPTFSSASCGIRMRRRTFSPSALRKRFGVTRCSAPGSCSTSAATIPNGRPWPPSRAALKLEFRTRGHAWTWSCDLRTERRSASSINSGRRRARSAGQVPAPPLDQLAFITGYSDARERTAIMDHPNTGPRRRFAPTSCGTTSIHCWSKGAGPPPLRPAVGATPIIRAPGVPIAPGLHPRYVVSGPCRQEEEPASVREAMG